jgi:D-glycero-alpha-D-manno-heptose 1-phosphate guanylyltransferase
LGTRLRSVVSDLPKALAPIAGQHFLTCLLRFLEMNGGRRVVLAAGYRNKVIHQFLATDI